MIRMITLAAVLGLMVSLTGCMDPEPGEISIIATKNGSPQGCSVLLFNSKGIQINHVAANNRGLVKITLLPPGTYSLKFQDNNDKKYPAERTVVVGGGESVIVRVELTEGPATDTP